MYLDANIIADNTEIYHDILTMLTAYCECSAKIQLFNVIGEGANFFHCG